MIALLQRVAWARVKVNDQIVAAIERGILVFIAIERSDDESKADRLLQRLLSYRVFPDVNGRMNRSVRDLGGGLLLVPQFTLAADTDSGTRPSFTPAAPPQQGAQLYEYLVAQGRSEHQPVASGIFGADMQVELTNDGPATFLLNE